MNVKEKDIKKWCGALDSGEYNQAQGDLQNCKGFCCLGVAVDLFNPKHDKDGDGEFEGGLPESTYGDPEWLEKINDDFCIQAGRSLSMLNDGINVEEHSFTEIATLLELVYIHKMLDA